ncbi:MAG: CDP-diacylglycerol--glycerol-3-phosphate 3-phosphatidyltransferase [Clostridia bacterium]|nr:CDP-diacylglycerol--glycerol-3-phosphate 3-phosphatidyltransferase [Clostridia bacterium]
MTLPNKITFLRIFLIPLFLLFALPSPEWFSDGLTSFMDTFGPYIAIFLFIAAGITDIIDGNLARKRNEVTNLGKFLDPIADKLLVISALLVLVVKFDLSVWIVLVIIARELMVMGIRTIAAGEGKIVAASIWGKVKTVMQIIAAVAWMLNDIIDMWYLDDALMFVALVLTIYSGIDYLVKNIAFIKSGHN